MVKLLAENKEGLLLKLDNLLDLKDVIPSGTEAQRELVPEHVETLILSDPTEWPPILVTKTTKGYIITDGYHRREAARAKRLKELPATSKSYKSENDVIEATFQANLKHGLKASAENRSAYAYWLHVTYPDLGQREIGRRAGITQSVVSKAIARRESHEEEPHEEEPEPQELGPEEKREHLRKTGRAFVRDAFRFFDEMSGFDSSVVAEAVVENIRTDEDRDKIVQVLRTLEEILLPKKVTRMRR